MTIKKGYEIGNKTGTDPSKDYKFIVTEGYADLSKKELQEMEANVRELEKKRSELAEKARAENQKIKQAISDLEAAPRPWERQLNKYKEMNSGGTVPPKRTKASQKANKDKKKGGCTGCAAKGLKRLILGTAALLKSELGVDAADQELQDKRKSICLDCDSYDFGVCNDCGCFTAAKVKLKTEKCPQEKW